MFLAAIIIRIGLAIALITFGVDQVRRPAAWRTVGVVGASFFNPGNSMVRYWGVAALVIGLLLLVGVHLAIVGWFVLVWWMWGSAMDFKRDWAIGVRDSVIAIMTLALIILVS